MAKGLFSTYHPAVCMLFFLTAICFSFCTRHPVYVVLTCLFSGAYYAYLKGARPFLHSLAAFVPLVAFIGLLNALFNSTGITLLWSWGPFSVTAEGIFYGLAVGGMLVSILLWFSCYNEVMTEDKFTYLFGRRFPTISLMVSMISRWIPRMVSRGRSIHDSQESLVGCYDCSKSGKVSRALRMATVLAGLGMEDSLQTADSMCARGYGSVRRTSYARYKWHARERVAFGLLIMLIVCNAVLLVVGTGSFRFYPLVSEVEFLWGYVAYAFMLALPFVVEFEKAGR